MKKTFTILGFLCLSTFLCAQSAESGDMRYIAVTGSAEVIVQPDEIELEIILKEYDKYKLEDIESNFLDILRKNNIDEEQLIFGNSNYYWYYWWRYRNKSYKQKTYKIKLDSSTDFLALVKDMDYEGVHSLRISSTSNKRIQELRKEVKISAMKAAKEKASYLLESIDEKVGSVLSIEEVPENNNHYWGRSMNTMSNVVVSPNSSSGEFDNVQTIKLRYEVKAKFEIK